MDACSSLDPLTAIEKSNNVYKSKYKLRLKDSKCVLQIPKDKT
jgi:hypothetical protein